MGTFQILLSLKVDMSILSQLQVDLLKWPVPQIMGLVSKALVFELWGNYLKAGERKNKRLHSLGQQDPRVARKQRAAVWNMGLRWPPKAAVASWTARRSAVTVAQTTLKERKFCH